MTRRLAALTAVLIATFMILGPALAGATPARAQALAGEPHPPGIRICIGADVVVIVVNIQIVIGPGECGKPEPAQPHLPTPAPPPTAEPKPPAPSPRPSQTAKPVAEPKPLPEPMPQPVPAPVVEPPAADPRPTVVGAAPRPAATPSSSAKPRPVQEFTAARRHHPSPLRRKRDPLSSVLIIAVVSVTVSTFCGAIFAAH
ncbi:MAG: hypothetical protein ABIS86_22380 [Streptosporangiaceae bacterium]